RRRCHGRSREGGRRIVGSGADSGAGALAANPATIHNNPQTTKGTKDHEGASRFRVDLRVLWNGLGTSGGAYCILGSYGLCHNPIFRPFGARSRFTIYPRLAPWALFLRRFAAFCGLATPLFPRVRRCDIASLRGTLSVGRNSQPTSRFTRGKAK